MTPLARLLVRRPDLTPMRMEDEIIFFECSRSENTTGAFSCSMPMREDYNALGPDWILELQRSFDGGASWSNDLQSLWFVRSISIDVSDRLEMLSLSGHDQLGILDRRIIAYYAVDTTDNGQTYYSMKNVPADTACYQVVAENFTTALLAVPSEDIPPSVSVLGTANRVMQHVIAESPAGPGIAKVIQVECAWQSVGEALRSIASASEALEERLLFDLVFDGANLVFRVWLGRRGADLTKDVLFSLASGNIYSLRMIQDYTAEATWIHVGGEGQGNMRVVAAVRPKEDGEFKRTPWYPIEAFVDAASAKSDQALMEAEGKREMKKREPRWLFSATASDSPGTLFGVDYHYGDTVSITHRGIHSICRVSRFRLRYEGGVETQVEVPLESELPL